MVSNGSYEVGDIVIIQRHENADEETVRIIGYSTEGFRRRFDFKEYVDIERINFSNDKIDTNIIKRPANEKEKERYYLYRFKNA